MYFFSNPTPLNSSYLHALAQHLDFLLIHLPDFTADTFRDVFEGEREGDGGSPTVVLINILDIPPLICLHFFKAIVLLDLAKQRPLEFLDPGAHFAGGGNPTLIFVGPDRLRRLPPDFSFANEACLKEEV